MLTRSFNRSISPIKTYVNIRVYKKIKKIKKVLDFELTLGCSMCLESNYSKKTGGKKMSFMMYAPTLVLFGNKQLDNLHKQMLPGKKALIVISSGKSVRKNGYLSRLEGELQQAGKEYVVFDKIKQNPDKNQIMEGAKCARENNCDFVVALGGGSCIDASKAISLMSTNEGDIWDYVTTGTGGGKAVKNKPLPIVAIATTAGTGSEADCGGVVTNPETNEKTGVVNIQLFPTISIVDPELMKSVPPKYTAYQGFDTFFHSAEGFGFKTEWDADTRSITITKVAVNNQTKVDETSSENSKMLIVYFSRAENIELSDDVDAVSSASLNPRNGIIEGNTKLVADMIQSETGGNVFSIQVAEPYPSEYKENVNQAEEEQDSDVRPELKTHIDNFDEYDTIFIGYPIWWSTIPMPVYSFLEEYDFSGKTVIPFSTHKGSGMGSSARDIKNALPNANVLDGFTIEGDNAINALDEVKNAINKMNFNK